MIQLRIMKNKIYLLIAIISAIGANASIASECMGDDCELTTITETKVIVKPLPKTECVAEQPKCDYDYNCPFDNVKDCEIWNKKPVYNQAVYPRAPHLSTIKMEEILYGINSTSNFSANDDAAKPLLQRYLMLQNASVSCCEAGIIYKMREKGASEKDIYNFLKDDANYHAIKLRCLMIDNEEIESSYSYGVDGKMIYDVRNACLCKNKDWFNSLLEPFNDVYKRAPQFETMDFIYNYKDSMNRDISISVNRDVQTTMNLLESCPK